MPFFENKLVIKEAYEAASNNTCKQHGFESIITNTEFASELKSVIYDIKAESEAALIKQDAKNTLAVKTLSRRHTSKMGNVIAQMATLINVLVALTTTLNDNGGGRKKQALLIDYKSDAESLERPNNSTEAVRRPPGETRILPTQQNTWFLVTQHAPHQFQPHHR